MERLNFSLSSHNDFIRSKKLPLQHTQQTFNGSLVNRSMFLLQFLFRTVWMIRSDILYIHHIHYRISTLYRHWQTSFHQGSSTFFCSRCFHCHTESRMEGSCKSSSHKTGRERLREISSLTGCTGQSTTAGRQGHTATKSVYDHTGSVPSYSIFSCYRISKTLLLPTFLFQLLSRSIIYLVLRVLLVVALVIALLNTGRLALSGRSSGSLDRDGDTDDDGSRTRSLAGGAAGWLALGSTRSVTEDHRHRLKGREFR